MTRAPDEPKKFVGDQEEPTEVTTVTKAPNKTTEVAHAPHGEEPNAVARTPEELLDVNNAWQQMKEVFAEGRPNNLSEFVEHVSEDVRNF